MLQGRQGGELYPLASGSLTLGLRTEQNRAKQAMALATCGDVDHPQDMARQALAATGGKSNLMATRWLLERRAEVGEQLLSDPDTVREPSPPPRKLSNVDGSAMKAHAEGEEFGPLLPSSPSLWGNNSMPPHTADGQISNVPAYGGPLGDGSTVKPVNSLPDAMDWLASSGVLERHPSVGSSSPFGRDDAGEGQLQLKLKPTFEQKDSIKTLRVSCSPEPEGTGNLNNSRPAASRPSVAGAAASLQDASYLKRKWQEEGEAEKLLPVTPATSAPIAVGFKQQAQPSGKTLASLAERMRPNSISEILGQDHLLGPHCVLRSLLDAETLPCIIFGGPPGTGKTSLARLIARSASCRFVALSSAKGASFEVQEILDEAKQARKFGQRTVLFMETMNRFNKSQQECLIPAIELGYVVFIGATAEWPSAELIPSFYSRCRVFTLRKLQHDHLCTALKRAISDHERGVQVSLGDVSGIEVLAIEDEVIQYLAVVADGDARVALNALEAAVYIALGKMRHRRKLDLDGKVLAVSENDDAILEDREKFIGVSKRDTPHNVLEHLKGFFQFSQEEYVKPFKKIVGGKEVNYGMSRDKDNQNNSADVDKEGSTIAREGLGRDLAERNTRGFDGLAKGMAQIDMETALVVTMADAREAFQWPQVLLEKTQDEADTDLMAVLLKTLKGGDSNAAVYWLARVLDKGEEPLKVASALTKFASDEVGLADSRALLQAVTCHQACRLMDAKDCGSHLTQCVVYLAMAPKSDALARAFQLAQKMVQDGPNEPVPSHLRSVSSGHVKGACYLPASLRNFTFLRWPESL